MALIQATGTKKRDDLGFTVYTLFYGNQAKELHHQAVHVSRLALVSNITAHGGSDIVASQSDH